MSEKENNIKFLILEYLSDENLQPNKISDTKLEFGFQFIYPPGKDPHGRSIGKGMVVYEPKNKELLIISVGTKISRPHVEALNSLQKPKKMQFFMDIRKHFLLKDVLYRIDIKNHRYEISDQIFLSKNDSLSKNTFFKSIRRVFDAMVYSNMILAEYCVDKIKPEDLLKTKDLDSGSDYTLYS
ncbi:MAG: DUF2299 family protein [Promethearchaeota archaeon]